MMACRVLGVLLGGAVALWAQTAAAAYPDRPIHLVVSSDAGTAGDLSARQLTPKLSELLGQNVVVENRGGAGGIVATEVVAKSKADGYTLLYASAGHAANVSMYKSLPYDAIKDFTPIGRMDSQYQTLVVSTTLPVNSVKELIAYIKERPGKLNFASTGNGTTGHLAGALFNNMAGLQLTHNPYSSAGPAIIELIGGQNVLMFYNYINVQPMISAGKLKPLAVTSDHREPYLPSTPTVAETGLPGFIASTWHGIYGPAGMDKSVVKTFSDALLETLKDPTLQSRMAASGLDLDPAGPEQFAEFTRSEVERYRKVVAISGAKIE